MKAFRFLPLLLAAFILSSCNGQSTKEEKTTTPAGGDLSVYYFHFTKRCATCNAVEEETKLALDMYYADRVKDGTIEFTSLNLDEDLGKEMAEQMGVSGQTLLVVKGEEKVNLTNEGFMNARTNPTKFHEVLKAQIDEML